MIRLAPWCLPAIVIAAVLWVTHPGYLSFDSAVAFWSARQGRLVDISGILLPRLWQLSLHFGEDTFGIRVLLGVLLGLGLGALGHTLWHAATPVHRWLAATVIGLCPVFLITLPHLWSDVLLLACLLWASVAADHLNRSTTTARRLFWLSALLCCGLAAALTRHNAFFALPPILWWGLMPMIRGNVRRLVVTGAGLVLIGLLSGMIRNHSVATRLDTWAVTLLYDLQAVSIATRPDTARSLIPANLSGPGLTVGELRTAWHDYSATRLFAATRSGVADPTVAPLTSEQAASLRKAWWSILPEPDYWQHRWRLTQALFGSYRDPVLRGQAESPGQVALADNPVLVVPERRGAALWRSVVDLLFGAGLASPILYLVLAALSMWIWRPSPARFALMASAVLYAAPYVVIAPSAELRYLLWPCVAAWIVLWSGLISRTPDASDPGD